MAVIRTGQKLFSRWLAVLGLLMLLWGVGLVAPVLAASEFSPLQFVPRQSTWMVSLTQPLNHVSPQLRPLVSDFFQRQWLQLNLGRAGDSLLRLDSGLTLINTAPISTPKAAPVWLIPIRNATAGTGVLTQVWDKLGIEPQVQSFQGISLQTSGLDSDLPLAVALVGDRFLLLSNSLQALKESLVAAQSLDTGLLGASFYQAADLALNAQTWGLSYLNLGAWQGEPSGLDGARLFLQWETHKQPSAGLGLKTTLVQSPSVSSPADPQPKVNLDLISPNPRALVWLGHNFSQAWQELNQLLAPYGSSAKFLQQLFQGVSRSFGFDFSPQDWSWLQEDFAVAVSPPPLSDASITDSGWKIELQTPNTPAALTGLATLEENLEVKGWEPLPRENATPQSQAWQRANSSFPVVVKTEDTQSLSLAINPANRIAEVPPAADPLKTLKPLLAKQSPNTLLVLNWADYAGAWENQVPLLKVVKYWAPSLFQDLQSVTWLGKGRIERIQQGELIVAWES